MRIVVAAFAFVLACFLLVACGRAPAGPSEISTERVLAHTRAIAEGIGPRPYDSPASARAAAYIETELQRVGLAVHETAVGSIDIPPIVVGSRTMMPARHADVYRDRNLYVRIPGATDGPAIVVLAHYDTVEGSPGAIDNATSIGILLELAAALAKQPPARPVIVAFPAAEEPGLAGSTKLAPVLAAAPRDVGLAISLDLVGHDRSELNGMGPLLGTDWLAWIDGAAESAGVMVPAPRLHRIVSRTLPQLERSDHAPFAKRGVPAFHLYGRGDVRIFRAYHSPWDTLEWVDRDAVDQTARFLVGVVRRPGELPATGGDPGLWLALGSRVVIVPRMVVVVGSLVLAAIAIALLIVGGRRARRRARSSDDVEIESREVTDDVPHEPRRSMGLLLALALIAAAWVATSLAAIGITNLAGHSLAWLHAPVLTVGLSSVFAALLGLLGWLGPLRRRPLRGVVRYVATGTIPLLALGLLLLASGTHELAWSPVLAAALLAVGAVWRGPIALVTWLASFAVIAPVIAPAFLQEIGFQMIYPPELPVPAFVGVVTAPHAIAGLLLLRPIPLPARRWVPIAAAVIAIGIAAIAAFAATRAPCTAEQFRKLWLGCEIASAGQ